MSLATRVEKSQVPGMGTIRLEFDVDAWQNFFDSRIGVRIFRNPCREVPFGAFEDAALMVQFVPSEASL